MTNLDTEFSLNPHIHTQQANWLHQLNAQFKAAQEHTPLLLSRRWTRGGNFTGADLQMMTDLRACLSLLVLYEEDAHIPKKSEDPNLNNPKPTPQLDQIPNISPNLVTTAIGVAHKLTRHLNEDADLKLPADGTTVAEIVNKIPQEIKIVLRLRELEKAFNRNPDRVADFSHLRVKEDSASKVNSNARTVFLQHHAPKVTALLKCLPNLPKEMVDLYGPQMVLQNHLEFFYTCKLLTTGIQGKKLDEKTIQQRMQAFMLLLCHVNEHYHQRTQHSPESDKHQPFGSFLHIFRQWMDVHDGTEYRRNIDATTPENSWFFEDCNQWFLQLRHQQRTLSVLLPLDHYPTNPVNGALLIIQDALQFMNMALKHIQASDHHD